MEKDAATFSLFFFVLFLIQGLISGALAGYVAKQKNRSYGNWFVLGFLFSLLALLALIAVPAIERYESPLPFAHNSHEAEPYRQVTVAERKCPFCAEQIKAEAVICRFCQRDISAAPNPTILPPPLHAISTISIHDCVASLRTLGCVVTENGGGKWSIVTPNGGTTVYAYSLADFQGLTVRLHDMVKAGS